MEKRKLSRKKQRKLIIISTVVGVIALFLLVAFFPAGTTTTTNKVNTDNEVFDVEENHSKSELEERIRVLEYENEELKAEVEKYRILAEQTTQAVVSPSVGQSKDTDDDKKTSSKDEEEYKSSSEYYDEDYKDYTSAPEEDSSSDSTKPSTKPTSKPTTDMPTSDTGL